MMFPVPLRVAAHVALFTLLALLLGSSVEAQDSQRIKLATLAPKGSSIHTLLQGLGEQWKQGTSGALSLTIYPDGSQGGEADMVRRMRVGQLQAALLSVAGISEIDDGFGALQNVPMRFRTLDEVQYVRQLLEPELAARLEAKGFILLASADVGWVRLFSKQAVLTPQDFQRTKLFTWAGDELQVGLMKAVGLNPVPLETAEILPGLQTGLIDAVAAVPFFALAGQFHTSAPHMLELDWAPLIGAILMTKKSWDALPQSSRELLRSSAARAGEQMQSVNRSEGEEAVAAMEKHGLVRHKVSPELDAQWRAFVEPLHARLRGSIVPAELFDRVGSLLDEYRKANTPARK